jgi:hypothetical protein
MHRVAVLVLVLPAAWSNAQFYDGRTTTTDQWASLVAFTS